MLSHQEINAGFLQMAPAELIGRKASGAKANGP